jgi:predicted nucleic acid-binding protein
LIVVADSSVIIALSQIGMLGLLHHRFPGGIVVPKAVWREVVEEGRGQPGAEEVSSSEWISVRDVEDEWLVSLLERELDRGESEAIVLAKELRADLVLLDERAARKVAKRLNLLILGTVGILVWAKRAGLVSSLREQLDILQNKGNFRISAAVYNEALNVVGEG